jgi:hypothetical protein
MHYDAAFQVVFCPFLPHSWIYSLLMHYNAPPLGPDCAEIRPPIFKPGWTRQDRDWRDGSERQT